MPQLSCSGVLNGTPSSVSVARHAFADATGAERGLGLVRAEVRAGKRRDTAAILRSDSEFRNAQFVRPSGPVISRSEKLSGIVQP